MTLTVFCQDYSFSITGVIPVKRLVAPEEILGFADSLVFLPEKRKSPIQPGKEMADFPAPDYLEKETGFLYVGEKRNIVIKMPSDSPERIFEEKGPRFSRGDLSFFGVKSREVVLGVLDKPLQKPVFVFPDFIESKKKPISLIAKKRTILLETPPERKIKALSVDDFRLTPEPLRFVNDKIKRSGDEIFVGYSTPRSFVLGVNYGDFGVEISNNQNRFSITNDNGSVMMAFGPGNMDLNAYTRGHTFQTYLDSSVFGLRYTQKSTFFSSVDYGFGIINSFPFPVFSWNSLQWKVPMELGLDTLSRTSYGPYAVLDLSPMKVRFGTGYDLMGESFYLISRGSYYFENLNTLLKGGIEYSGGLNYSLGAESVILNMRNFGIRLNAGVEYGQQLSANIESKMEFGNLEISIGTTYTNGGFRINAGTKYRF